jgi:hypothetical protein
VYGQVHKDPAADEHEERGELGNKQQPKNKNKKKETKFVSRGTFYFKKKR